MELTRVEAPTPGSLPRGSRGHRQPAGAGRAPDPPCGGPRAGASDGIPKPRDPAPREVGITRARARDSLREEPRLLRGERDSRDRPLIGESPALQALVRTAQQAAASNATILLRGESGTGKEILARALHRWSPRRDRPLVTVNCVALSEELLESELFGHEKGAFTGAHQRKPGKVELAHGGTLFLDEIGDIRPALQAKLLRLIQEQECERVGGTRPIRVDVRFVAATNTDLGRAMTEGRFRPDLYYRLNVVTLVLPPLRARKEDIQPLARHFIAKYSAELQRPPKPIAPAALAMLTQYKWPGNVRELENAIERAVVLSVDAEIGPQDLPLLRAEPSDAAPAGAEGASRYVLPAQGINLAEVEREFILQAVKASGGRIAEAAALLQLSYRAFYYRLRRNSRSAGRAESRRG